MIIKKIAYGRAGLIGNPSDGYHGKTISIVVKNFHAEVVLYETPELEIIPSTQDHSAFGSMGELIRDINLHGYYGGVRLIKATVKQFVDYCQSHAIELPPKNFTIRYQTNVPRQVGVGGSSAIVTATLKALMEFYNVEIPKAIQPNLVLGVETDELGISAGLQDRVIIVYEGVVYMDFAEEIMERQGYGDYVPLDPKLLPPIFIAYRPNLSESSGVFHNEVRHRFEEGKPEVVQAMRDFAGFAEKARDSLLDEHPEELGPLMDANFDRRASIYEISEANKDMVMMGRKLGAHVKFTGSGGAVIGVYEDEDMYRELERVYREGGYEIFRPVVE